MESEEIIKQRMARILPILDESQRRIYLGSEATSIGRGGISIISRLSGADRGTVSKGMKESLSSIPGTEKRHIRKPGGGRKKETDIHPEIVKIIQDIVSPHTMGDPEKPLIWTSKSLRKIALELKKKGYTESHELVRKVLLMLGFSLQSNKKTKEGGTHIDRDAQFEYINDHTKEFFATHDPVISVDCKKKELIGEYKNNGKEWAEEKHPVEVKVYDFIDKEKGKACPYGIYDLTNNRGWVNVGIDHDTAAFAVFSISDWWENEGKVFFPSSSRLYINADGGGSNASNSKLWKENLQQFSNDSGLEIHVSHFPPGTSKWNKIEHRLFSFISKNWRAKPLTSIAVILSLINAVTTTTGLKVTAKLDSKKYQTGIKISKKQEEKWNIKRNKFHGEWNYIITPNLM